MLKQMHQNPEETQKRLKCEDSVETLNEAIKFNQAEVFTKVLTRVGCGLMEPETNGLLEDLIRTKNLKFLYILFTKACTDSYNLYKKALAIAHDSGDRFALKTLLLSVFSPFSTLTNEIIDYFLDKNDLDAIVMILDIGFHLEQYRSRDGKNIAHVAVEKGRLDVVKRLTNRATFYEKDYSGKIPIFYAQDRKMIKEIRRKCPLLRDQTNSNTKLTTWQESLLNGNLERLNGLISLKRRIKKFKRTFLNFYRIGWVSTASILQINRENILEDSFKQVSKIHSKWYKPRYEFFIKFIDEVGLDSGGLKVDWVNNLFKKFFSESSDDKPLFIKINEKSGCFAPNTEYNPKIFKFAGSIVALSIGLGVPMKVKFIPAIYHRIYEETLQFSQGLREQSQNVYDNLLKLQDPNINLSELALKFPKNPRKKVIKRNLSQYIEEYSKYSVYGAYEAHIEAFVEGFKSVLSEDIRNFLTKEEFIKVLIGKPAEFTADEFLQSCHCN